MKTIRTYIRAFFYLGRLGAVIGLLALAVLVAAINQSSASFNAAVERMNVLNVLESEVVLDLAEMQTRQADKFFSLTYGLESDSAFNLAQQADERITQALAELEEYDSFYEDEDTYTSDLTGELAEFEELLAQNRQIFEFVAWEFDEMDDEEWWDALIDMEDNQEMLHLQLRSLIIGVEQDRQQALADFPEDANSRLLIIVIVLAATLLLALIGYQLIATTVSPLPHLRNAVTAIGGDIYQPDQPLAKGAAGSLAKALDELAHAEQTRNQSAKQEIENLRQALYESRRRRLKIYQPGQKTE